MRPLWVRVNPSMPVQQFNHTPLLAFVGDQGLLISCMLVQSKNFTRYRVDRLDLREPTKGRVKMLKGSEPLKSALPREFAGATIVTVPPWMLQMNKHVIRAMLWLTTGILAVGLVVTAIMDDPMPFVLAFGVDVFVLVLFGFWRRGTLRIRSVTSLPLNEHNIVQYAKARLAGETPRGLPSTPRSDAIRSRVERIREQYGALRSDVVHRIDHPALFDGAAPTTAQFLGALAQFEQLPGTASIDELEAVASQVEVGFAVARQHAETVGIHHVPEHQRDDVRRASKAARLAAGAATEGERTAALEQLRRILGSLALHYLPDVAEIRALEAPPSQQG